MLKKIILIIIAIIILGGAGYFIYQLEAGKPKEMEKAALDPKNCTYIIEGKNITLKDGYSEEAIVPGSASKIITQYFGNEAIADLNGDGLSDTAFILTQDSGGSGTFYYVAVALSSENGCRGTNALFLGDRIAPQTTSIDDNKIIVNYAERLTGEPMTVQPSIGITRQFALENTVLKEVTSDAAKKEQSCLLSGGVIGAAFCCKSSGDFPSSCLIGACGCSAANSYQVKTCDCGADKCFNGTSCVPAGSGY